jgi:hypothetical protein
MKNFLVSGVLATLIASAQIALAIRLSAVWSMSGPVCGLSAKPEAGAPSGPRFAAMTRCIDDTVLIARSHQLQRVVARAR